MKLATVRTNGGTALAGVTEAGVLDLSGALPGAGDLDSVDALCAALAGQRGEHLEALRRLADSAAGFSPRWAAEEVQLLAPLQRPGKVNCVGLNYRDHCRETGIPEPAQPVLFA